MKRAIILSFVFHGGIATLVVFFYSVFNASTAHVPETFTVPVYSTASPNTSSKPLSKPLPIPSTSPLSGQNDAKRIRSEAHPSPLLTASSTAGALQSWSAGLRAALARAHYRSPELTLKLRIRPQPPRVSIELAQPSGLHEVDRSLLLAAIAYESKHPFPDPMQAYLIPIRIR